VKEELDISAEHAAMPKRLSKANAANATKSKQIVKDGRKPIKIQSKQSTAICALIARKR
jgi:hypothetical protein